MTATPSGGGAELVSVERFRLTRPYTPRLWPRVVPELDLVSQRLAGKLHGRIVARRTVSVDGRRARQYEIAYTSRKTRLAQRLTFVLVGRREYQLSCRWPIEDSRSGRTACAALAFRLS